MDHRSNFDFLDMRKFRSAFEFATVSTVKICEAEQLEEKVDGLLLKGDSFQAH